MFESRNAAFLLFFLHFCLPSRARFVTVSTPVAAAVQTTAAVCLPLHPAPCYLLVFHYRKIPEDKSLYYNDFKTYSRVDSCILGCVQCNNVFQKLCSELSRKQSSGPLIWKKDGHSYWIPPNWWESLCDQWVSLESDELIHHAFGSLEIVVYQK
ncbi:hypothetical protein O6P43_013707 [Quillaja saponaria]|uniref:Uncharacterized protein n=1 Tax=Quillaja saponaria TaxID=32244 RepID=A0AAD7LT71_QUISA|nr:hypothetical protein O6P43_013707 [Quillaja saponaria]